MHRLILQCIVLFLDILFYFVEDNFIIRVEKNTECLQYLLLFWKHFKLIISFILVTCENNDFWYSREHYFYVYMAMTRRETSFGISWNATKSFSLFQEAYFWVQFLPQNSKALVEEEIVMILRIPSALCSQYGGFEFHKKHLSESIPCPPPFLLRSVVYFSFTFLSSYKTIPWCIFIFWRACAVVIF